MSKRHPKWVTIETQSIVDRSRGIRKLHNGTNAQSSTLYRTKSSQVRLGTYGGKETKLATLPVGGAGLVAVSYTHLTLPTNREV